MAKTKATKASKKKNTKKAAPPKKAASKKAPAKKAAAKKAPAKKAAGKKAGAVKAAPKKAPAKKAPAKKPAAKKAAVKKSSAKKAAPKSAAVKAPLKKAAAKAKPAKKVVAPKALPKKAKVSKATAPQPSVKKAAAPKRALKKAEAISATAETKVSLDNVQKQPSVKKASKPEAKSAEKKPRVKKAATKANGEGAAALTEAEPNADATGASESGTTSVKKTPTKAPKEEVDEASLVGSVAPSFELQDQEGTTVSSESLLGKPYVLYFYPKDDTPGCTKESCDFRDGEGNFRKAGVTILGVSPDSIESHASFAQKYDLPFSLLSDPEKTLANAYGTWALKKNYGKEYWGIVRSTFLVGADGKVKREWRGVRVDGHADAVLAEAMS